MKHLLKLGAVALFAMTAAASAATYKVDGLVNDSYDGFRSSLIHSQKYNGDMSGKEIYGFDETVKSGGTWEDDGDISFSGSLEKGKLWYTASGNIDADGGGYLKFLIGKGKKASELLFSFNGKLDMGPANSYSDGIISLWGDTGTCKNSKKKGNSKCYGIDLRIAVTPSEVPLPASAVLLLAGLGGLVAMRRKKS